MAFSVARTSISFSSLGAGSTVGESGMGNLDDLLAKKLEVMGKKALLLIWDNASWHKSKFVNEWIAGHNRKVKNRGRGVRIVVCLLPKKSP